MAKSTKAGPPCVPGDMVRIPYDGQGDSATAAYGRVVYCDTAETPKKRWRGLFIAVLDRDVKPGDAPEEAATAPVMLGPVLTTYDALETGAWTVLGNVPPAGGESEPPLFESARGIENYGREPVEDTPENRQRMITERMFPPDMITDAIRAKRGLRPWIPLYDKMLER